MNHEARILNRLLRQNMTWGHITGILCLTDDELRAMIRRVFG